MTEPDQNTDETTRDDEILDDDAIEVFSEIEDDEERARIEVKATEYLSDEGLTPA